ncbi:MAG: DeoR/GlpR transcriptional regulator [Clostridia bacterium]|nr:DeoR/GlpR transcriptional regulator [Clostridia bacterium]
MSYKDREGVILEYLREKRTASVEELCRELFVSEPTMRRDLRELCRTGKIVRTYGGASYRGEPGENLPTAYREREHSEQKTVIAKKSLELIDEGDTIMVDASSSADALLRLLAKKSSIVVITNSAKAPITLADTGVKLFVTGGELATGTYAYVGSHAESFLREFNADICFFSIRTLTADGALTDNAMAENAIRRIMLSRAKRKVLMMDSKKIGEACLNTLCSLEDIDTVVCESDVSDFCPALKGKFLLA